MNKDINSAVEAADIVRDLFHDLSKLPYNSDLYKLCRNIDNMVSDLSRLEVYTRRTPPRSSYHIQYNKLREEIRNAIKHLQHLMLMLRLMA